MVETLPLRLVAYALLAAFAAGVAGYGLLGLRADTQQVEVERELGRLGGELRSLAAAGEGSRRTLELRLPDGVEWVALGVDPDPDGDGTLSNNSQGAPGELLYRLHGGATRRLPWGLCLPLQAPGGAPVLRGGGTRRLQAETQGDTLTGERSLRISGADLGLPAPAMGGGGKTLRLQRFAQGGATADINISGNGGRVEVELPRGARVQRAALDARGDPAETSNRWNLVLLLDGSTSMIPLDPTGVRKNVSLDFIERASPYDRIGVVEFHREARLWSPLRLLDTPEERDSVRRAVESVGASVSETRISPALREARRLLQDYPGERRGAILLTDGISQTGGTFPSASDDNESLQEAREMGREGTKLFTVQLEAPGCGGCHTSGVPPGETYPGRGWGGYLLHRMAQATGGESFYAPEAPALETLFRNLTQFILHYPENPRLSIAGQEDPRWRPQGALPRG
ncbi:MAG: VWA domain-containing protein, partial [Euryarchaeota archaeon]|nr:VWA domain-containing protein [Euryarchaeota archaeon]